MLSEWARNKDFIIEETLVAYSGMQYIGLLLPGVTVDSLWVWQIKCIILLILCPHDT